MAEDVQIAIADKVWRYWDDCEINLGIDSYSTVTFMSPHEPKRREFRETFRPFSYKPVSLRVGTQPLFVGNMLTPVPTANEDGSRIAVSCYSKPAVLMDCDAPVSLLPFEARGLTLLQIAERVCAPFGVRVAIADGLQPGPPFRRVKQKLDGKVHDYLVELAQQRGLVIGDDATGRLVFRKSTKIGRSVASLEYGKPPVLAVSPSFNDREYFSQITGIANAKMGVRGAKATERNPRLTDTLRCQTAQLDDIEKADIGQAVKARMGRMFGNAMSLTVELPTWRDPQGALWWPNTTVRLLAPEAMVYSWYEFIVRTVSLRTNKDAETATLGLALPGAFSGEIPPKFPWD